MGDNVSTDLNNEVNSEMHSYMDSGEILNEIKIQYRLIRKKASSYMRTKKKKPFTNILYLTLNNTPVEYICSFQKQYPDKNIKVLVPHLQEDEKKEEKIICEFEYFLKNKKHTGTLYKYPINEQNIEVYGIYSDIFKSISENIDIYDLKYLPHFIQCSNVAIKKIKPDIVHSNNIPIYLGNEFNGINKKNKFKLFQTIHDFSLYKAQELFWSAINLANKKTLRKISRDKTIRKNLAALFGIKSKIKTEKVNECLEYLYEHYEEYREKISINTNTNENILLERLNKRIAEMFPNSSYNSEAFSFNPLYYTLKKANYWAVNSLTNGYPEWANNLKKDSNYIQQFGINICKNKIKYPFDITNFRIHRQRNKNYFIKEFSENNIETQFTDTNLFDNELKVSGFLDNFYKGILIYVPISNNLPDSGIKEVSHAILKCIEKRKNIQTIFSVPFEYKNEYLASLINFMEEENLLKGKWLFLEGTINIAQIFASSDLVLLPDSDIVNIEDTLFSALKYGCIPITSDKGILGELVTDIFDDMNNGCGFKKGDTQDDTLTQFQAALIRAVNFYTQNTTSWNSIIKNALSYNHNSTFELIEKYNNIYNKL